ncbi:MAG: hypothetical protein QM784_10345 [Polyangiaceae bacterium]
MNPLPASEVGLHDGFVEVPSLATTLQIYGAGMMLVLESREFLRQVELLKRLSLNAEVQAANFGQAGEVFQTIARELGFITRDTKRVISDLMAAAREVSGSAIESAALARLCEKYQEANERGMTGATLGRVQRRRAALGAKVLVRFGEIRQSLNLADGALRDIERLGIQLPMVATLLRIEAHRDAVVHQELATSATELISLEQRLATLLGKLQGKTASTLKLLGQHK